MIRVAIGPMIRGYHRGHADLGRPIALPALRPVRRPSPLQPPARVLGARSAAGSTSGSSARTCCRSRSAGTSSGTSSSSSAPRSPTGADTLVTSGRRWSNHCRLTAAAGAKAGLARPPRALRAAGRPARARASRLDELLGATVHQLATAERAEREALWRASSPSCGRPAAGRTSSGSAGAASPGRRPVRGGHRARSTSSRRRRRVRRPSSCPRRPGGTQAGLVVGLGVAAAWRPRSTASLVARPEDELRPSIEAQRRRPRHVRRRAARGGRGIVLDGSQLGDGYGRRRPPRPRTRRACSPGPRGSSSTRSTRRRRWPASSPWPSGELDGQRVVFWHAGGDARAVRAAGLTNRPRGYSPADRHASRSFIRPAVWRTAPA